MSAQGAGWRLDPPTCEHCGRDGATVAGLCTTCQVTTKRPSPVGAR